MKLHRTLGAAAIALSLTAPAGAADILAACADDVSEYCPAVELGHGRLAACLYAHETVISDGCYAATSDVGDILDTMFDGLRAILEMCGQDIAAHCGTVQPGEGRIFTCLAEHQADLSPSCSPAVGEFSRMLPEAEAAQ